MVEHVDDQKVNWAEKLKPVSNNHKIDWKSLLREQAKKQYSKDQQDNISNPCKRIDFDPLPNQYIQTQINKYILPYHKNKDGGFYE